MNNHSKLLPILLAAFISIFAAVSARAQQNEYMNYGFVVFETTVTRKGVETSDNNPQERRFYVRI